MEVINNLVNKMRKNEGIITALNNLLGTDTIQQNADFMVFIEFLEILLQKYERDALNPKTPIEKTIINRAIAAALKDVCRSPWEIRKRAKSAIDAATNDLKRITAASRNYNNFRSSAHE